MAVWPRRELLSRADLVEEEAGLRSLKGEDAELPGQVYDLDLIGDEIPMEVVQNFFPERFPKVQDKRLVGAEYSDICQNFAAYVQDRGIEALAREQRLDIVRDHSLKEREPIRAQEADETPVAEVQQPDPLAHGAILLGRVAEMAREQPPVLFDPLGPVGPMAFCERGLFGHNTKI